MGTGEPCRTGRAHYFLGQTFTHRFGLARIIRASQFSESERAAKHVGGLRLSAFPYRLTAGPTECSRATPSRSKHPGVCPIIRPTASPKHPWRSLISILTRCPWCFNRPRRVLRMGPQVSSGFPRQDNYSRSLVSQYHPRIRAGSCVPSQACIHLPIKTDQVKYGGCRAGNSITGS